MNIPQFLVRQYLDSFGCEMTSAGFAAFLDWEGADKEPEGLDFKLCVGDAWSFWAAEVKPMLVHGFLRHLRQTPPPTTREEADQAFVALLSAEIEITGADWLSSEEDQWFKLPVEDADGDDEPGDSDDIGSDDPEDDEALEPTTVVRTLDGGDDADCRDFAADIASISAALHRWAPEHFAVYALSKQFDRVRRYLEEMGVALAAPPGERKYRERALYYLEVNAAFQQLRATYKMTPVELHAFMYDMLPQCFPDPVLEELPTAERAWLLLADPDADFDDLDAMDADTERPWQGSVDMRVGDLAVMWCRSPRSSVHSIWRVVSPGTSDPFFFHYRLTRIAHGTRVPPVTFKELSADPVWAVKPATRAHFQNAGGREITCAEYEALVALLDVKGASNLPGLFRRPVNVPDDVQNESDVETRLLEPLFGRLGLAASDWTRQLRLRMGRGHRVYPDYAFDVRGGYGEDTASFIVEAKYRVPNDKALTSAYQQAFSYALRLDAAAFMLCAVEGIWFYARVGGGFAPRRVLRLTWDELASADRFALLRDAVASARERKAR